VGIRIPKEGTDCHNQSVDWFRNDVVFVNFHFSIFNSQFIWYDKKKLLGVSMKTCVIFCAGGFSGLIEDITKDQLIIAADGGLVHTDKLGITPGIVLGDFDSLGYVPAGANVFPVEKDDTDAMLAVRKGLKEGCTRFLLYGSLDGPRLDHTVANFQTLQFLADRGATGYLIGNDHTATVVKNGEIRFPATAEGIVSVFCMGADATGVTLEGLQYSLTDGTLTAGFPLGVSNHFIGQAAKISVENGSLLVIFDRKNGLPTYLGSPSGSAGTA